MDIAPTQSNLLDLEEKLEIAEEGYDLLEEKREVMIMELMGNIRDYKDLEREITDKLDEAYDYLEKAYISVGKNDIDRLANNLDEPELEVRMRSVMGVPVPEILIESTEEIKPVPLQDTDEYFDKAYIKFREIIETLIEWAAEEAILWRLGNEINKTQKRVNALDNKFIQKYKAQIKKIEENLEEEEREEFFRRKKLKDKGEEDE